MATTPTSTPRWQVSAGRRSRAAGVRQEIGQKEGWVNRLQGEEEEETASWQAELATVEEGEAASRAILAGPGAQTVETGNILLSAVTGGLVADWTSPPYSLTTSSWCRGGEGRASTTGLEGVAES